MPNDPQILRCGPGRTARVPLLPTEVAENLLQNFKVALKFPPWSTIMSQHFPHRMASLILALYGVCSMAWNLR